MNRSIDEEMDMIRLDFQRDQFPSMFFDQFKNDLLQAHRNTLDQDGFATLRNKHEMVVDRRNRVGCPSVFIVI